MVYVILNFVFQFEQDVYDLGLICLFGIWILKIVLVVVEVLCGVFDVLIGIDVIGIEQFDLVGVLQVLCVVYCVDFYEDVLQFCLDYQVLVCIIEEVVDDWFKVKCDFGVLVVLEWLGVSVYVIGYNIKVLCSFFGENLVKVVWLIKEFCCFWLIVIVYQMEQVGLDVVLLVVLLFYLVGVVIVFFGLIILCDFGVEIYVVELVNIVFLCEFVVLLIVIVLVGCIVSVFIVQIGVMKVCEEIDVMCMLGLDLVDLLVLLCLLVLLVILFLLIFIVMIVGLVGGIIVGVFDFDILLQMYIVCMYEMMEVWYLLVGLLKVLVFVLVIGLIGCLEGLKVEGIVQLVGECIIFSVVQMILLVIIIDVFVVLWFMYMDW